MSKKTTCKSSAGKPPRASKRAARGGGAAGTDRLRKAVIAEIDQRLEEGQQGHEAPSRTPPKGRKARAKETSPAEKRPSGLDLAAEVLLSAGEPLNARTIADRVLAAGWTTTGKTPHATLYAAIIREIASKGAQARFRKTERGLFASNGKGA